VPELVTLLVDVALVVLVPVAVVCQYQATSEGGVPNTVSVTPGGLHWGEFEVGVSGVEGMIGSIVPFTVTLSFVQLVVTPLAAIKYKRKVTELNPEKTPVGKVTDGV
jgi:hypothetical protein